MSSLSLSKAQSLKNALTTVAAWRAQGETIVFTNGCFDILHAGHVEYLTAARALGDRLVLGLNTDVSVQINKGPDRPIVPQSERVIVMSGLSCVDLIVLFDSETPIPLLQALKPDIQAKGGDYVPEEMPEYPVVTGYGGRIAILPFRDGNSTTNIIAKILKTYSE